MDAAHNYGQMNGYKEMYLHSGVLPSHKNEWVICTKMNAAWDPYVRWNISTHNRTYPIVSLRCEIQSINRLNSKIRQIIQNKLLNALQIDRETRETGKRR